MEIKLKSAIACIGSRHPTQNKHQHVYPHPKEVPRDVPRRFTGARSTREGEADGCVRSSREGNKKKNSQSSGVYPQVVHGGRSNCCGSPVRNAFGSEREIQKTSGPPIEKYCSAIESENPKKSSLPIPTKPPSSPKIREGRIQAETVRVWRVDVVMSARGSERSDRPSASVPPFAPVPGTKLGITAPAGLAQSALMRTHRKYKNVQREAAVLR